MNIENYINFTVDSQGSCPDDKKKPYLLPPFLLYGILNCMVMKEIKLTKGQVALVDDEDYEYLNQWEWRVRKTRYSYYVLRGTRQRTKGKYQVVLMHREIMNPPQGMEVDHIDHNQLNNQKSNLRICTHRQNTMNRVSTSISSYLGVSYVRGKPCASINIYRKRLHLGIFNTEYEAARAYDKAAKEYFGEFANLNFKE